MINKDSNEMTSSESLHQMSKEQQSLDQEMVTLSTMIDRISEQIAINLAKLDKIMKNKSR